MSEEIKGGGMIREPRCFHPSHWHGSDGAPVADCPMLNGKARPAGPDPDRDRRRAVYAAAERRKLVKQFDAYLRDLEREAVDNYDTGFSAGWDACGRLFTRQPAGSGCPEPGSGGEHPDGCRHRGGPRLQHNCHYGVPESVPESDTQCNIFPTLQCTPKREQCQTFCIRNGGDLQETYPGSGVRPTPGDAFEASERREDWLGEGTPRHTPTPTCIALRPDASRSGHGEVPQ